MVRLIFICLISEKGDKTKASNFDKYVIYNKMKWMNKNESEC